MVTGRLAIVACYGLVLTASSASADQGVLQHVRTLKVDEHAWHFNTASFDQDKILSVGDFQYTLYWDADKTLVVVRRDWHSDRFERLPLSQYTLTINPTDGHRNTVVGVSRADGRLHLSWDHHNNPLRYTRTRAGFVTEPPDAMKPEDFEPAGPLIPGDDLESRVTYPRFLNDGSGRLFFIYRDGGSGSGDNYIHRYDAESATWSRQGTTSLFSRRGLYPPWENSTSRNAYLNDVLFDSASRLHVTWTYREAGRTWASNHDLHYAYSDDSGITWQNNTGRKIADIQRDDPIELADPGIVVWDIPVYSWLMNQTTMAIDSRNRPHVITYKLPQPFRPKVVEHNPPAEVRGDLTMSHYWCDPDGVWHSSEPSLAMDKRPGVVFDAQDNMIVYRAENGGLTVHWARAAAAWEDWKSAHIDIPGVALIAAGKPDRRLAATAAVVSFAAVIETAPGQRGFAILDFDILPRR